MTDDGENFYNQKPVPRQVENIKVCALSDLHEQWRDVKVPKCDLLVVAGDLTYQGDYAKVQDFNNWCALLKSTGQVKEVVCIAGNHDLTAERDNETFRQLLTDCKYLQDEMLTWNGLNIYGAPWTPSFYRQHWVFNADRGREIRAHWDKIPHDVDILITHGPAYGVRDRLEDGEHVGCWDLRQAILAKNPRVHICGHIHCGYGLSMLGNTFTVNASTCTERYKATNTPIVFDIVPRK